MSGAGLHYAGYGPAGCDPVAAFSSGPVDGIPRALDWRSSDFTLDAATGQYDSIHPIDQRVRLALLRSRYRKEGGRVVPAMPAEPTQGFDWVTPFEWGEKLAADVKDRIRDAIARAGLALGTDLEEVRIDVSSDRTAGRISWDYTYRRLVDGVEVTVTNGTR